MQKTVVIVAAIVAVAILGLPIFAKLKTSAQGETGGPEQTAKAFMEAGNSKDVERCRPLLTEKAWEGFRQGYDAAAPAFDVYTVGEAAINGSVAEVPIQVVKNGEQQTMTLKMRSENGNWLVHGVSVYDPFFETQMTIDFENPDAPPPELQEFGAEMEREMEQMMKGMMEGMQDAFREEGP